MFLGTGLPSPVLLTRIVAYKTIILFVKTKSIKKIISESKENVLSFG